MKKSDIFLSIILMIISIIIFILTFQFPKQTVALPPTAFPRFVSVSLFLFSLILFFNTLRKGKKVFTKKFSELSKLNKEFLIKFTVMILLAYFYTIFIRIFGYIYTTPLFVAGNMFLFNEKRIGFIFAVSIITTILLYILFKVVFKVPLPRFNLF